MTDIDRLIERRSRLSPAKQAMLDKLRRGRTPDKATRIVPAPSRSEPFPLSFAQQSLWFLDQFEPGSAAYNTPIPLRLHGPLDVAALQRSLDELVRRHEALRTTFAIPGERPVQLIGPPLPLAMRVIDLRSLPAAAREDQARRLMAAEMVRPFDLARGPMLRAVLLRVDQHDHVLLLITHHIVFDGSTSVFLHDFETLYNAFAAGCIPDLPAPPIQYADFAAWQRHWLQGTLLEAQIAYWKRQLGADLTPLQLPTDRPRPPAQTFRGARHIFELPSSLAGQLKALGRAEDATLFMTCLAAFQLLLGRYSGQEGISVGTPVAQRSLAEVEHVIGCFVNTLVLRTDLSGNLTARELLRRVRDVALDGYAHADMPFEMLVEALQPERDPSRNPLYQVMFVLQHASTQGLKLSGLNVSWPSAEQATARFDMLLSIWEHDQQLSGSVEYSTDLFDPPTIQRIVGHFQTLLHSIAADPDRPIRHLELLSLAQRHTMLLDWNDTAVPYQRDLCLHHLFERQAARTPQAIALVFDYPTTDHRPPTTDHRPPTTDESFTRSPAHPLTRSPAHPFGPQSLTYQQLNQQSNRLAHLLRSLGIGRGSMVAIFMDRAPEMLPALLGILKAGAAYVPMELLFPPARVQFILASLQARCLITQAAQLPLIATLLPLLPALEHLICLDTDEPLEAPSASAQVWTRADLVQYPCHNLPPCATADDLAYVIFTSGSTGTPKGVMVRHQPVINLIEWVNRSFAIGPADQVLFVTSLCFDLSVYDIFGLLAAGGSIRLASSHDVRDPERLLSIVCSEPISLWDSAPAALLQVVPFLPAAATLLGQSRLRLVFLSGDWIPVSLPDALRQAFTGAQVISLGGATEATVWSNYYPVGQVAPQWVSIPYGRPIQNAAYYILDAALNPCPVGVAGELHIGGECLASGYANEPALTASKFIPNPFVKDEGGRMKDEGGRFILHPSSFRLYKTGDQARFWPDGTIEFLGRIDQQVKLRGYRIELGEIESVLSGHPSVRDAIVLAREDAPGEKRLVAYIVPKVEDRGLKIEDSQADVSEMLSSIFNSLSSELRAFLRDKLPEYMLPSAFVLLDSLPVTANGKLDRRALPRPSQPRDDADAAPVAPRSLAEHTLAQIWSEVLHLDQVGIHDNFFLLGGDSILSIQIIARARLRGLHLATRDVFRFQTIAELATVVGAAPAIAAEQDLVSGAVPLTPIQHWFFSHELPAPQHWNQSVLLEAMRPLDLALLEQALQHLLAHHDALRLRFSRDGDTWRQQHAAPDGAPCCQWVDLSSLPAEQHEQRMAATASALQASLDLAHGPLLRAGLFHFGRQARDRLLLVSHHLVVDAVSWRLLLEDLRTAYEQLSRGESVTLPPKTTAFKVWAERLASYAQSAELEQELLYWRYQPWEQYRPLPVDYLQGSNTEATLGSVRVALCAEETRTLLLEVLEVAHAQITEVLLAALAVSLASWRGSRLLLVDLEGHGREALFEDVELSRTVGWHTALYPVLLEAAAEERPMATLQMVKEQLRGIPKRGIGYGVLRYLNAEGAGQLAGLPMAEVSFNYLGQFEQATGETVLLRAVGGASGATRAGEGQRTHLLEILGAVSGEQLTFEWNYSQSVHSGATIEGLAERFVETLRALVAEAQRQEVGYTPSDFPLTQLSKQQLDKIVSKVVGKK